jgi:hypothetical protein
MKTMNDGKVHITIRVFPFEKEALRLLARADDQSIDRLARILIREGLKVIRAKDESTCQEEDKVLLEHSFTN